MSNTGNSVPSAGCRVALLIVLAALPANDARGQTGGELEAEVRRLEHEVTLAEQEDDSIHAIEDRQAIARFVRVPVGGLELLTLPELRTIVEEAGKITWEVLSLTYQDSIAVILREFPISVVRQPRQDSTVGRVLYPRNTRLVFAPENEVAGDLATSLLAQITQEIWLNQDEGLREWMKAPPSIATDLSGAYSAAYLDLVTSASPIAQRCLAQVEACLEALGLERPADPAADWYSPGGRRQLVIQFSQNFQIGESRQSYDRCITGSDRDCLTLLRDVADLIPGTLLPPTRTTFLRVALENGGPGSYPVLLASAGQPIALRLAQTSGASIAVSVREWHGRVIAARPSPTTIRGSQALAAIGWTAVLVSVALRSSRWR